MNLGVQRRGPCSPGVGDSLIRPHTDNSVNFALDRAWTERGADMVSSYARVGAHSLWKQVREMRDARQPRSTVQHRRGRWGQN